MGFFNLIKEMFGLGGPKLKVGILGELIIIEQFGEKRVQLENGSSAKVTDVDGDEVHFRTGGDIFGVGQEHWVARDQCGTEKTGGDWVSDLFGPGAGLFDRIGKGETKEEKKWWWE